MKPHLLTALILLAACSSDKDADDTGAVHRDDTASAVDDTATSDTSSGDTACDDRDGDGVCDSDDPCPDDVNDDSDGDGVCDSDDPCPDDVNDNSDGDGVCDSDDPCPDDTLDSCALQYVLVADSTSNDIFRYDLDTGALVDTIDTSAAGLVRPMGMTIGPDGMLYVPAFSSGGIFRFDATTGAFVDEFIAAGTGGLTYPAEIAFRDDGYLYVNDSNATFACGTTGTVRRYDATTGAFVDDFIDVPYRSKDMTFGPDGDIYLSYYCAEGVARFDGTTGAWVEDVVPASLNGYNRYYDIMFSPYTGDLYVAAGYSIMRFEAGTFTYLDSFGGTPGFDYYIASGPDGAIYSPSYHPSLSPTPEMHVFDLDTQAQIDSFAITGVYPDGIMMQ